MAIDSDFFSGYLEEINPQYAVMLNGNWGSGKTYFWKNVLEKELQARSIKPLYVSLFGTEKIDDISSRLLLAKMGLKHKKLNACLAFGSRVLGRLIKTEGIETVTTEVLDFSNCLLCFDDIERSKIDIKIVLGYINSFVEHSDNKVLIICNDEELDDKDDFLKCPTRLLL